MIFAVDKKKSCPDRCRGEYVSKPNFTRLFSYCKTNSFPHNNSKLKKKYLFQYAKSSHLRICATNLKEPSELMTRATFRCLNRCPGEPREFWRKTFSYFL